MWCATFAAATSRPVGRERHWYRPFMRPGFRAPGSSQAVLNLGGIANLTLLGKDGQLGGFDCGPGNVLMDLWIERHRGVAFDDGWVLGGVPGA